VVRVTEPRRAALEVLTLIRRGELADRALAMAGEGLEPRDQAWLRELAYGTLRMRGRIDFWLAAFVRAGLEPLDPIVLDVLRLGVYQLVEMGSVPPYAAVSQAVELVRSGGAGRAAGLVNGVLQSFIRGQDSVQFPSFAVDPVEHLATWESHPRWLVERWVERWGPEEVLRLVQANNTRPDLYLTPVGVTADAAVDRLQSAAIGAEAVAGFPDSVRILPQHGPIEALVAVPAVVQDPAAAAVVRFASAPDGSRALDISAAPGGKTVGLATSASYVVAADLSLGRIRRVRANVDRVGVADRVGLVVSDGRRPPFREVDLVLLDAPCTGTGTFRRHVDGRWRITRADIEALATLQRELLAAAATLVTKGGTLVYATCSLEPEENERQVDWFREAYPRFRLVAPTANFDGTMLDGDFLRILPQQHGVDGAFAARLEMTE
jgi:16S rRNA (cytosine967-C5)-methyltransferase